MKEQNYSIVLVDDDPDDHFLFDEALKAMSNNHSLVSVYTGQELMDYLLSNGKYSSNSIPKPDVIISDVIMPILNGFELLKLLKSIKNIKKIPFYFLSSTVPILKVAQVIKLGAKRVLRKTFHKWKTKPDNFRSISWSLKLSFLKNKH